MSKPLIMVVEDDQAVKNLITTTLETQEYKYITAANGQITFTASFRKPTVDLAIGLKGV